MTVKIILCPECNANYPPAFHSILEQYGKCVFCDTLAIALLSKGVPEESPLVEAILPMFPHFRLDLGEYVVDLPFLDRYADQMFLSDDDKKGLETVVKLELIRAQIKTMVQTVPV